MEMGDTHTGDRHAGQCERNREKERGAERQRGGGDGEREGEEGRVREVERIGREESERQVGLERGKDNVKE